MCGIRGRLIGDKERGGLRGRLTGDKEIDGGKCNSDKKRDDQEEN